MTTEVRSLTQPTGEALDGERFETLLERRSWRLERIVSPSPTRAPGPWYDQDNEEWVALLSGHAALRFEDEPDLVRLGPGDCLVIAAHRRHRVEWIDGERPAVWLALHFQDHG